MSDGAIPTLAGIQRLNAGLLAAAGLVLLLLVSPLASLSCLVGGGFVIANLFALAWLGRMMLGAASRQGSPALGAIAMPLKLLLAGGLIYLLFARTGIDALGFGVGVATQGVAVIIATCRASIRRKRLAV